MNFPTPLRRISLLALVIGLAVLAGQMGGCSSPAPVETELPTGNGGACGSFPTIFDPLAGDLVSVGTDSTLDLATWNLKFFPLRLPGDYRCPHPTDLTREQLAANVILTLQLDIVAVQEISDPDGFADMIALCPGYAGMVSPEDRGCNYQRPGIIYREDQVTVNSTRLLFTNNEYAFPRSPFEADLTIRSNGRTYDLNLIVVHLKASSDASSFARRQAASAALKDYLDEQALADSTLNYMIAGDWNDQIEDRPVFNAFENFIEDPVDFQFLDMPMAGLSGYSSYVSPYGSLIDHLLINRAACPDFSGSQVAVFKLDQLIGNYDELSDHRPVMVQAPVFR